MLLACLNAIGIQNYRSYVFIYDEPVKTILQANCRTKAPED